MAPHSSTLAQKIPWTGEPGGLQSMGSQKGSDMTERLHFHFSLSCTGEGNGNPHQCSCLENPMDGEAWQAAVHGVAQSRTRLKRLSSSSSSMVTFRLMNKIQVRTVPDAAQVRTVKGERRCVWHRMCWHQLSVYYYVKFGSGFHNLSNIICLKQSVYVRILFLVL